MTQSARALIKNRACDNEVFTERQTFSKVDLQLTLATWHKSARAYTTLRARKEYNSVHATRIPNSKCFRLANHFGRHYRAPVSACVIGHHFAASTTTTTRPCGRCPLTLLSGPCTVAPSTHLLSLSCREALDRGGARFAMARLVLPDS